MLDIKNLKVKVDKKLILRGLSLQVNRGEVVAVMGPNGSGKSTLAYTLAGHPQYEVAGGEMRVESKKINDLSPDKRAKKGVFLGFQYPVGVSGVGVGQFLRLALEKVRGKKVSPLEFREIIKKHAKKLKVKQELLERSVNEGFSGGEKKKMEILQMAVLRPKIAILDETDSGLDIDALRVVAEGIEKARKDNPKLAVLLITHYQRILKYVKPDRVVVIKDGRVVREDGPKLVGELEKKGYEAI